MPLPFGDGPADWTTVAGIVALTQVASTLQSAAVTNEILNHLFSRTKSIPRPGYCCYEYALIRDAAAVAK